MRKHNQLSAEITTVNGFRVAGVHCGLKKDDALDFALITSDNDCTAAGVFTTNQVKAAPLLVDMNHLKQNPGRIRAVAINTVSANACTGQTGIDNAERMAALTAQRLACEPEQVLVLSTGVIGTQLSMDKIQRGIDLASESLGNDWRSAATAIMTTDTRPKLASITAQTANGETYTIAGISKGSGMIAPNMATMLGVIVTDARLSAEQVNRLLRRAADQSFNRIVVDGDMSTNDTVFLLANGYGAARIESTEDEAHFLDALTTVCTRLAQDIVRDGEGVTKFITLHVKGVQNDDEAQQIGKTIATSALVKTAFYGNDANWGRIIAAAGRAGVPLDANQLALKISASTNVNGNKRESLLLVQSGTPTDYDEVIATRIISQNEVTVELVCGNGHGQTEIWTCDFSHEYVTINGDYRT